MDILACLEIEHLAYLLSYSTPPLSIRKHAGENSRLAILVVTYLRGKFDVEVVRNAITRGKILLYHSRLAPKVELLRECPSAADVDIPD